MAWVRPKHPKRKEPVDPAQSLVPLLSFFSGRRSTSPTKPKSKPPAQPQHLISREIVSRDPILRDLLQAQAAHEERPTTSHSHKTPHSQPSRRHAHHRELDHEEEIYCERVIQRPRIQYERSPSPLPLPPPKRRVRPEPRVASYERPKPRPMVRERHVSRYRPSSSDSEAEPEPYWAVSSRFARSATPYH